MALHNCLCPSCWLEHHAILLDVDFGDDHEADEPGLSCKFHHYFDNWAQVEAMWARLPDRTPPTIRYEHSEYREFRPYVGWDGREHAEF